MATDKEYAEIREVVGVFDNADTMQEAIDELLSSGFDQANISLLADAEVVDQKLGRRYRKVSEIEDDPAVPRSEYVSIESIEAVQGALVSGLVYIGAALTVGILTGVGGTLAATVGAVALAGGGGVALGAALAKLVGDHHARYLQRQIERGGLLLWVRTWNKDAEKKATEILSRHSGHDVHAHILNAA
jgi:hypothetical protein